jgi:hypothetical protein
MNAKISIHDPIAAKGAYLFIKKKIEIENNLFFITKDDKYIGVNWK